METPLAEPPFEVLTPFERVAFRLMRFWNLGAGKDLALFWQRRVVTPLVGLFVGRRLSVHGLEWLSEVPAGVPILLVSNHRTFFDLWVLGSVLIKDSRLRRRTTFPVRANFFYENPFGLLICMIVSGGSMFPPFFRSAEKMSFNKASLALLIDKLRNQGQLVGFHPEGTRNPSDNPYELLPAQPGAGELALKARPIVIPAFITGMTNSAWSELWANVLGRRPIVAVFGSPVDLSAFPAQTRLSHHKRCADMLNARILALSSEERALRAQSDSRGS